MLICLFLFFFQNDVVIPELTDTEQEALSRAYTPADAVEIVGRRAFDFDVSDLEFLETFRDLVKETRPSTTEERLKAFRANMTWAAGNTTVSATGRWRRMTVLYAELKNDMLYDNTQLQRLVVQRRAKLREQGERGEAVELRAQVRHLRQTMREERGLLIEAVRQLEELREQLGLPTNNDILQAGDDIADDTDAANLAAQEADGADNESREDAP